MQVPSDGPSVSADLLPEHHGLFCTPSTLKQPSGPNLVLFLQIIVKILFVIILLSEMKTGEMTFY